MDYTLSCNALSCRAKLSGQAVVTTCSHIFCLPCANSESLSSTNSAIRKCPACQAMLPNQDDAAVTNLDPTEDYKTSVLSGLTPSIIIECASRAMAFWTYQTTQEILYQDFLMKSMSEKYQSLSGQMDKLIANANSEVSSLRDRLQEVTLAHKELDTKNQQLAESYKKKCKDNNQLTKLYQQAKQKLQAETMAEAAEADASHLARHLGGEFKPGAAAHHGRGTSDKSQSDGSSGGRYHGNRLTFAAPKKSDLPRQMPAPDSQRTRLPTSQEMSAHLFRSQMVNGQVPSRVGTPLRQPLAGLQANVFGQNNVEQYFAGPKNDKSLHRHLQRESVNLPRIRKGSVFGGC